MMNRKWLSSLSQTLATVLAATSIVLLQPTVEPALALQADGSDSVTDYSVAANSNAFYAASGASLTSGTTFTFESWVKPKSQMLNPVDHVVVSKHYEYAVAVNGGEWVYWAGSGGGWGTRFFTGVKVTPGAWTHIALVLDGSSASFFVNGSKAHGTGTRSASFDSNSKFTLGGWNTGAGILDAEIDEVKIWDTNRVANLAADMHSRTAPNEAGLVAYWDFNEGSGSSIHDRTGNYDLSAASTPSYTDVKHATSAPGGDTIITFPRTYLPGVGGWTVPDSITSFDALVVGAGGAGGARSGGGGGGGAVVEVSDLATTPSATVSVTVGAGGLGGLANAATTDIRRGTDGQSSSMGNSGTLTTAAGGARAGAAVVDGGASGNGNAGGLGLNAGCTGGGSTDWCSGGGGGAGGVGLNANGSNNTAGNGGPGLSSSIIGTTTFYGGGGGGGADTNVTPGSGGSGGGGAGTAGVVNATNGSANTGGGGGGGGYYQYAAAGSQDGAGGSGGSGVVILRYTPNVDQALTIGATDLVTGSNVIPTANNVSYSFEAWVYPTNLTGWRGIINQSPGLRDGLRRTFLGVENGVINFSSNGGSFINTGVKISANQWSHLAVAVAGSGSNGEVKIYLNGHQIYSTTSYNRLDTTGSVFHVGGTHVTSEYWVGQIDQVKIWQGALSATDVAASMHAYSSSGISSAALQSLYDFNEFNQGVELNRVTNQLALSVASTVASTNFTSSTIVETGTANASDVYYKFKRSYLNALGGWVPPAGVATFDGAAVAGGGGGSSRHGGGGGAGELVLFENANLGGGRIPVVVGQGGLGVDAVASSTPKTNGSQGQSTKFGQITLSGGGFATIFNGQGGSGSGGQSIGLPAGPSSVSANFGAYQFFGNAGGAHTESGPWAGGGGGGADSAGVAAGATGGQGGNGKTVNLTGAALCLAAGGGGGADSAKAGGQGGSCPDSGLTSGGEGSSGYPTPVAATASAIPNSGSGGGGGGHSQSGSSGSGNGGSGVVILSYSLAPDEPTSLTAVQSTSHATVNLSWTAPSYVGNTALVDYAIEYKPAGGNWTSYSDSVSTATNASVVLPTQCVAHEFRVFAKNSSFNSVASSTVSAVPVWGTFVSLTGVQISSTNSQCVVKFQSTGSNSWSPPIGTDAVRALVVGGGGGGGSAGDGVPAGGGGAGGFIETIASGLNSAPLQVYVGAGGSGGGSSYWSSGLNGGSSVFDSLTAAGGGGGGGRASAGSAGGSGGGAGGRVANLGGSGTAPQGFNGGSVTAAYSGGGGGGGAGSAGSAGGASQGGQGGAGSFSSILGQTIAAGGAGASENSANNGASGAANTGNGGGGGGTTGPQTSAIWSYGGAGGSGLIAIMQISVGGPVIVGHPQSTSGEPGQNVTLSVSATANGTLSYQWQSSTDGTNWSNVGGNSSSYTTPTLALGNDGTQYRVVITNTLNGQTSQLTSSVATLSVTGATITTGACTAMVGSDAGVTISETANGACLVEYTSAGNNTFYVPNLVSSIQAFIVGGGGGGGGAKLGEGGGGGGGGAASRVVTLAVTSSQIIPLTVGSGGSGGAANSNGQNGGTTSISSSNSVPGGSAGKSPTSWPGGAGEGGTGASALYASSGGSGGNGATDPGDRSYYQPKFGNAGSSRTFAGEFWCVGGGGGGGNREVSNDVYFQWEPRSQYCSDGQTKSGGSGGWHNGTTNVLPTSGLTNRGGGGGGGSYNSSTSTARSGANGADGIVAIYFLPGTGDITLSTVNAASYSGTTHTINLTKDNPSTTVTWTTSNALVCTVTGNASSATVTEVAAGLCEVSVVIAASTPYARGSAATSFQIDKISRTAPAWTNTTVNVPYGTTLDLRPKLANPGSDSFTFSTSGTANSCSVTGSTLTVGSVGDTCNVTPTLLGTAIYLDMVGNQALSVTVTKISQSSLVITSARSMNVNQTLTVSAAGGSGVGALSYHVAAQGTTNCSINSSTGALTASASGDCEVYAQRALSTNYDAVTSSHVVVAVNKVSQNLSWVSQPQAQYVSGNTYALVATASSQLTVAYSISAGLCTLSGSTVTFTGSGDCVIQAGQAGDGSYFEALTISQTVSVGKINQTITFSAIADKSWGSLAFSLSATVSSGLAIAYSESNQTTNDSCDVSVTGIVTVKNVGTCAITATQVGNASYTSVAATRLFAITANQAGAPFIGSVSFGDRQLNASFFTPSYLGGGTVSAYEMRAYELDGTLASTNTGCIANLGATQSCSVAGLDNGKKYVLRVAAITQAGLGQLSVSSSEIIPAANPEAVGNLIAIEGNGSLALQWTQPTSFGGGSFFQYRIYWRAPGQQYQADGSPGATVGAAASTSFNITGLTNGVAYDVKIVTATSNNNVELQSNTAEVRQTPYTVPDAPAAVVALDNNNNLIVAWQPPQFDGGNPIDQYVVTKDGTTVCNITSASTTSCEVAKPSAGSSSLIEVKAGNDAGLSVAASTSVTIPAVLSIATPVGIGGGTVPVSKAPGSIAVSGSSVVSSNELLKITGINLDLVQKVLIGDQEASFFVNSDDLITIRIPATLDAGKPVITLFGIFGSRTFANLIEIKTSVTPEDSRVTVGTFLGFAAVYTKNHEGKRLSIRIGDKWRVIKALPANYTYNLTKVGTGKTITVMVYVDRVLAQVQQVKVQ